MDITKALVGFLLDAEVKECPNHKDCTDKKSSHYFMAHMTQEEFRDMSLEDFNQRLKEQFPEGKIPGFNKIKKAKHRDVC
jgi:hypothetical protein